MVINPLKTFVVIIIAFACCIGTTLILMLLEVNWLNESWSQIFWNYGLPILIWIIYNYKKRINLFLEKE